MADPIEMRFYCSASDAEPVGPWAVHTLRGRPRKVYTLAEAAREVRWPEAALIALYNATYPPKDGIDDPRLAELAEALYHDPAVRSAMLHFYGHCGRLPASVFLLTLLTEWDMADAKEGKCATILEALEYRGPESRTWFDKGRPGDRGQYEDPEVDAAGKDGGQ